MLSVLGARAQKLSDFLQLGSVDNFVLYNSCDVLPPQLANLGVETTGLFPYRQKVLEEAKTVYRSEPARQVMYYDQHTFLCSLLDRNDRMTMGASIECRVPFLDYRLVEGAASLPSAALFDSVSSKPLLRRALGDRLPQSVLDGPKWGFGVPWHTYFREEQDLRSIVHDIDRCALFETSPLSKVILRKVTHAFLSGSNANTSLVRQLFYLAVWYENSLSSGSADMQSAVLLQTGIGRKGAVSQSGSECGLVG
jgi:asparagine synthase (glutamine-hydrolysing)